MVDKVLVSHGVGWGLKMRVVKAIAVEELRKQYHGDPVLLSINFVGKAKAKRFNILYRKMDYIPQVLGFPMDKEKSEDGLVHLGDILICTPKLKYEAILQNKKLVTVLREWLAHGIANLFKESLGTVDILNK